MKWIALGLALGVVVAPSSAAAASCVGPPWAAVPWRPDGNFPADGFPVDAEIWLHVSCGTTTSGCSLIAEDHTVALAIAAVGDEVCSLDYRDVYDTSDYVLRLTPNEPLLPAHTYRLECEALVEDEVGRSEVGEERVIEVVTRADGAPSSPAIEVVVAGARQVRSDSSLCWCDPGDAVALDLGDLDEAYLREGGRIEATYPNGQVFPIAAAFERSSGEVHLPYTDGPIELTPVAANGTRGATVRVEPDDVDDQAVYIPCRSSMAGPSRALWWLGPVLWIGWRRRRRTG